MAEVELVNAEVLRVGPGETLIARVPESWDLERVEELVRAFEDCGLERALVIRADGVEFAVAARE